MVMMMVFMALITMGILKIERNQKKILDRLDSKIVVELSTDGI